MENSANHTIDIPASTSDRGGNSDSNNSDALPPLYLQYQRENSNSNDSEAHQNQQPINEPISSSPSGVTESVISSACTSDQGGNSDSNDSDAHRNQQRINEPISLLNTIQLLHHVWQKFNQPLSVSASQGENSNSNDSEAHQNQQPINEPISYGQIRDGKALELYKAAVKGNVTEAKRLFGDNNYRSEISLPITERNQTVLHLAAGANQTRFVGEMLKHIEPTDLVELRDLKGNTAFCMAAIAGAKPIAVMMLKMNPNLLRIRGGRDMTPLHLAAFFGQRDMAAFLYEEHKIRNVEVEDVDKIFVESIRYNLFDLSLSLLNREKNLNVTCYDGDGPLHMLAKNPSAFNRRRGINLFNRGMDTSTQAREMLRCLLEKILKEKGENFEEYIKPVLFVAARVGNSIFLAELIDMYPNLVLEFDENGRSIFHIAFLHSHVSIFSLLKDKGLNRVLITCNRDGHGNNLLHLVAQLTDSDYSRPFTIVSGAGLRMHQELKTFKEVESLVLPSYRQMKNNAGLTPRELFTWKHKDLLKEGEKWMYKTANSFMLVATIIASVVYAVGFSVPGGYKEKNGIPARLENVKFRYFALTDAAALSFSSISILMFLSIQTSGFEEDDFLKRLPLELMVGIFSLLISIAAMMLSFILSFFLDYSEDKANKTPIVVSAIVCVPVVVFVLLHLRLLKDIFLSLFCSRISN